ncbi:hypothetical protein [Sphingobacterium faecium]
MYIIEAIQYAPADQLVSWVQNKNTVRLQPFSIWISLPMHVASGEMTHTTKTDKAGTQHTINISARLKNQTTLPDLLILALKMYDGAILIVGTPDIPVQVNESNTLYINSLSISYTGINPPLILQDF